MILFGTWKITLIDKISSVLDVHKLISIYQFLFQHGMKKNEVPKFIISYDYIYN